MQFHTYQNDMIISNMHIFILKENLPGGIFWGGFYEKKKTALGQTDY